MSWLALAGDLGAGRQMRFLNQYVEQETLIRYLQATDIDLTPFLDRNQNQRDASVCALAAVERSWTRPMSTPAKP